MAAAHHKRCEDAKLHFELRVSRRRQRRKTGCRTDDIGTTPRYRTGGSSDLRTSCAAFYEQPPHLPLDASPQLQRRLRHRPRLRARRLGACHNRRHIRSHLLGALDYAAQDPAALSTPGSLAKRPGQLVVRDSSHLGATGDQTRSRARLRRAILRRNLRSIISQNCRGLKTATRKTELLGVLRRIRAFAACLQETWREAIEELLEDGWLFVGSAPAAQRGRGSQGVGIALSPQAAAALDEKHVDLGPRVTAVRLLATEAQQRMRRNTARGAHSNALTPLGIFLISGYAPVSTASDSEWDDYYDALSSAIARAHPGDVIIIGTDCNASIGRGRHDGSSTSESAGAVGPHGLAHINASGRRLRSFMETHALASLASFFRKQHYGTWQHPRSKLMHQLDHMLVTRAEVKRFTDAGSLRGQLINSDHRPVGCKLRVAIQLQRKRKVNVRSKLSRLDYSSTARGEHRDSLLEQSAEQAWSCTVASAPASAATTTAASNAAAITISVSLSTLSTPALTAASTVGFAVTASTSIHTTATFAIVPATTIITIITTNATSTVQTATATTSTFTLTASIAIDTTTDAPTIETATAAVTAISAAAYATAVTHSTVPFTFTATSFITTVAATTATITAATHTAITAAASTAITTTTTAAIVYGTRGGPPASRAGRATFEGQEVTTVVRGECRYTVPTHQRAKHCPRRQPPAAFYCHGPEPQAGSL